MFVPVAAPMGFSGAFSSVRASVFSAHFFSDAEAVVFKYVRNRALRNDRLSHAGVRLLLRHQYPTLSLMIEEHCMSDKVMHRPNGWWGNP